MKITTFSQVSSSAHNNIPSLCKIFISLPVIIVAVSLSWAVTVTCSNDFTSPLLGSKFNPSTSSFTTPPKIHHGKRDREPDSGNVGSKANDIIVTNSNPNPNPNHQRQNLNLNLNNARNSNATTASFLLFSDHMKGKEPSSSLKMKFSQKKEKETPMNLNYSFTMSQEEESPSSATITTTTSATTSSASTVTPPSYRTLFSTTSSSSIQTAPNSEERPLKRLNNSFGIIGKNIPPSYLLPTTKTTTTSNAFGFSESTHRNDLFDLESELMTQEDTILIPHDDWSYYCPEISRSPQQQEQQQRHPLLTSIAQSSFPFGLNEFDPWTVSPSKISSEHLLKSLAYMNFGLGEIQLNTTMPDPLDSNYQYEVLPSFMLPLMSEYGIFARPAPTAQTVKETQSDSNPSILPQFTVLENTIQADILAKAALPASRKLNIDTKSKLFSPLKAYLKDCVAKNKIQENNWIIDAFSGKFIDFSSIKLLNHRSHWTIERGAAFIHALIPYIKQESHFEDILSDFLKDFFFKHVFNPSSSTIVDSRTASNLLPIAESMISHLIHPSLFKTFLTHIEPHFRSEHIQGLFCSLVTTMKSLTVPVKTIFDDKYVKPERPELKDLDEDQATALQTKYDEDYARWFKNHQLTVEAQESFNRKRRLALIQKQRSFDYLRLLLNYWPLPEGLKADLVTILTGPKIDNQDFFDVLYFSDIIRGCMAVEDAPTFIKSTLDPIFNDLTFIVKDFGSRYLHVLDRIILLTRFNFVANKSGEIIHNRRYLLKYLLVKAASLLNFNNSSSLSNSMQVFNYVASLNLQHLFEAINLYQISPVVDELTHLNRLETFISDRSYNFDIAVIYFAYNPLKFASVYSMLQRLLENGTRSTQTLKALMEIFAAVSNVPLPPLTSRKVFQFMPASNYRSIPVSSQSSFDDSSTQTSVEYNWNMSLNFKAILRYGGGTNYEEDLPKHPYSLFAARILLARQFGLPFSYTRPFAQQAETFTWLETVECVNLVLEKATQLLREESVKEVDNKLYSVFRVVDPQAHAHQSQKLPVDEPTHPIKLFYNAVIDKALTLEQKLIFDQYVDQTQLLAQFFANFADIPPSALYFQSESPSSCVKILALYFEDCLRLPKPSRSELKTIFPQIFHHH